MNTLDASLVEYIRNAATSDRYGAYLRNTLMDLCAIDTAPTPDLADTAARERELFDWIERELRDLLGDGAVVERSAIDPAISDDADYAQPAYAGARGGRALTAAQVYANRTNLLALCTGAADATRGVILHAHVDVVPPWFAPRCAGERLYGRGACDNKGQVAVLLAQIKLLSEVEQELGRRPTGTRVYQFVIEEEIGGNGSLALARDGRFAGMPVIVHECTSLVPYCAHRGALDYRCRLGPAPNDGLQPAEMFPFVVLELEAEGRRLQEETDHPLFTPAHVQTNHGRLGPYGHGPGTVCDRVAIEVRVQAKADAERVRAILLEQLDAALADYARAYRDMTAEADPATGQPRLERHFDVTMKPAADAVGFRLEVFGCRGHMAAPGQCDNAIVKAAHLLAAALRLAPNYPGTQFRLTLADHENGEIMLEGCQGFAPSHAMSDVKARLTSAARRGLATYCRLRGRGYDPDMIEMMFDRLHNDPYADAPDGPVMGVMQEALSAMGEPWPEPTAWHASCDARIYHRRGHPVVIFGAGHLEQAHTDSEYVDIPDLQRALGVSTLAAWHVTQ